MEIVLGNIIVLVCCLVPNQIVGCGYLRYSIKLYIFTEREEGTTRIVW